MHRSGLAHRTREGGAHAMDVSNYIRFLVALVFVLALIGLLSWIVKRYGFGGRYMPVRGQDRRLKIVEMATVDSKRRVVLVRCDAREHLVLVGGASDVVIDAGLPVPAAPAATPLVGGDNS